MIEVVIFLLMTITFVGSFCINESEYHPNNGSSRPFIILISLSNKSIVTAIFMPEGCDINNSFSWLMEILVLG